jgi:hypothetical protein
MRQLFQARRLCVISIGKCSSAALEAVGIGFPFEIEDGQFKPAGVTYSPGTRMK